MEALVCPNCGSPLHFEEAQEYCYCSHCGTQVYKEDVHFDKKIELEKFKIEKEIEDKENERKSKDEMKAIIILFGAFIIMFSFAMLALILGG